MLTRMSVGIFLAFIATASKVIIFVVERSHPDINSYLIIPETIRSFTFMLLYPVPLEFTVAQSPVHMRGVMVGLWYASWGLGYLISTMLKFPFACESQYICTSFYYYITKSVLVLIILIVFVILAKHYKYRVRENEVNIVQIVDDHYQRYINQREQFGSDIDILVLVWNYLIYSYYILLSRFTSGFATEVTPATWYNFTANIIQYNIDQLVGASADELSSVIYWHILSEPLVLFLFYLLQCLFYSTSGVSVSLVLVSHSFFKHKLENISLIKNPIKLIVRVLCYARNHKYPENRSALTYWEEEAPSRLDLGKDKYGGPFTEEEVEDVKTVFRMLPLFIGVIAFVLSDDYYWSAIGSFTLPTCLAVTDSPYYFCSVILIVCFYKYIPSMLTRISVGIFLAFIVTVSKVIIFVIERPHHSDINNFGTLLFIPQTIQISLEFTVAQSPVHMRGVMVGLWYATSWGFGLFGNTILKFPFYCGVQYICTSFYYYITKSVLVLIILIVFVILAKRYKYRVRENESPRLNLVLSSSNYVIVSVPQSPSHKYGYIIVVSLAFFSFPLFGLLADVWIGSSKYFIMITFISSGVSVSLVLVSHSFFKHKLVLCYARKHKYPENRSALTYWEEEAPSRPDLGKDKYGGPFTEEEVEDVKTVFCMLPLFIGFVALNLKFVSTISKAIIFVIERSHPVINISLKFTVAQSPVHMRGVMVGLWYAACWGFGLFLDTILKFLFDCESQYICTNFCYYITKSVLVLIILIVFVILAKHYKYRVRKNEVNIVQIVDDHYQRYINQREQFMSGIDSDSPSE
uniref:Uncharacterized protein n=1 Tax=Amphimedon queenslandica TaxID=400682 RepID=A0A1X7TES9_AMPQE